jgi:hypothetical protein
MKTTIDIADDLIDRARVVQKRNDITLRALVEEGLRLVLDKHGKSVKPYKFEPVVVGKPYRSGMPKVDVNALIAEGYAEREAKIFVTLDEASGRGHARVAEERATYEVSRRRTTRRART